MCGGRKVRHGGAVLHNDVLRSLRFMLKVNDSALVSWVALGGGTVSPHDMVAFLRAEDEPGFRMCDHQVMAQFLNGLIIARRGPASGPPRPLEKTVNNNLVLKKLRVAFELKDDDVAALVRAGGLEVSKPELSALFRAPGHHNFRPCGDQLLRHFLKGLTAKLRGDPQT